MVSRPERFAAKLVYSSFRVHAGPVSSGCRLHAGPLHPAFLSLSPVDSVAWVLLWFRGLSCACRSSAFWMPAGPSLVVRIENESLQCCSMSPWGASLPG